MSDGDRPYRVLGWHLKQAREQQCESMAEVSGAVEIEIDVLERIESGRNRPTEDILMLLVNHFDLEELEANSLWELAGYVTDSQTEAVANVSINIDPRVIYSDSVNVSANEAGVVINFLQSSSGNSHPILASRVGMSHIQAEHMLEILRQSLEQPSTTEPKKLSIKNSQPTKKTNSSKKNK